MGWLLLLEGGRGRWQLFAQDKAAVAAGSRRWDALTAQHEVVDEWW